MPISSTAMPINMNYLLGPLGQIVRNTNLFGIFIREQNGVNVLPLGNFEHPWLFSVGLLEIHKKYNKTNWSDLPIS